MFANYIDGAWVASNDASININPSDVTDIVGEYCRASAEQAQVALEAAHRALPTWRALTPQQRCDALDNIGNELLARKEELGTLLAREEGKTKAEGIGEVDRAARIFKFFAGECLRIAGEKLLSLRPGIEIDVVREPVGVVGIITPWNFPMAIPAWKIAPALAFGNTVVFKPADLVSASAWSLAEIIARAGLPPGTFNLVMGRGTVVGNAILHSKQVNAISFTGSVDTGRTVVQTAATYGKKVQAEMGGKNPVVILEDCDFERAINVSAEGSFFSTGQRCTASSRLLVDKRLYPRFVKALGERADALVVGHALDPRTQIGPVVDQAQLAQDLEYIAIGQSEGARLVAGGTLVRRETNGHFLQPAVFAECNNSMRLCREEIFGPIVSVIPVDDYEEALHLANDTPFGLSAGICTSSLKYATHFKQHARAGMVMVNAATAGVDYHVPFGGVKDSSIGPREQGRHAIEFFTSIKTTYTAT